MLAEARTGGTYAYTYNSAGRMAEFKINGILQASYKYDAMGRQAIRTLSSPTAVTIHSVFDSEGRRIAEYDEASGALLREYAWLGWDPIAVIEGGTISFIRADHIGRPVFATNSTGTKVWSATYNPFGGVHTSTGTLPPNRFPGQWFQSESGLHQNWMRDYDPTTGRYLQADPLGLVDGASVYGYVRQSPGMMVDPSGEYGVWGAAVGAGTNLGGQLLLKYYYYRDWGTAFRCVDWWNVFTSAVYGAAGLGPWSLHKTGQARHIPAAQIITRTSQRVHTITINDECECLIPPDRKLPSFWDLLINGSFL